mgnify:CR=1 FL=1
MEAPLFAILAGTVALSGALVALRLDAWRAWILALCAGALIGAAVLLLLPDAVGILSAGQVGGKGHIAYLAVIAGFFAFFLISLFFSLDGLSMDVACEVGFSGGQLAGQVFKA